MERSQALVDGQKPYIDDDGKALIDTLIKPKYHTSWPGAQRVHGISPIDVRHAPTQDRISNKIRKVVKGKVTKDVEYLPAMEEADYTIAQANSELDVKGNFITKLVSCRRNGDFVMTIPEEIKKTQPYQQGQAKHFMIAIWKGIFGT